MENEEVEEKSNALILAEKMERIATAMEALEDSPVSRKLMVLYIHDKTKVAKGSINLVLDAVESFVNEFQGD